MDKYIIINETYNAILCKDKYSSRRYRQDRNNIDKHCVIVKTTKGRAEQERDYLNKNYNEGWEIQKIEPEEEVKRIEKETAEKILNEILFVESVEGWEENEQLVKFGNKIVDKIEELAKKYGVEVQDDKTRTRWKNSLCQFNNQHKML